MYRILSCLCWAMAIKSGILGGVIFFTGGSAPEPLLQTLSALQSVGFQYIDALTGVLTFVF